ncbi:unnamed protein product [Taenia asiatica]|uniref:Uncharacterized protein n=1 Tax=Taenia asiatica TaxID=60517 RepID=A0A3P6NQP3_TAEAS|nr:unnamed protein product [Taenia asiatica]
MALAYLQALMSYYERQFRNCEIHLEEDRTMNESGCNAAQDETTNFRREESQVDFIDVDNSAGELNNRFECKHSEEIKHEHPSDILGTKQNLPSRIKKTVFEVVFYVQKFLVRFILAHMTVVNLGQWMGTVVQEVMVSGEEEGSPSRLFAALNVSTLASSFAYNSLNSTVDFYRILAVSIALFQLRVLGVRQLSGDGAFDDDLLLIGLLGILFYNMFLLVPAMEGKAIKQITGIMFVSKSVLEILQALMQVFLILEASRSQASNVRQTIEKPGRTVLTFLLILNLAMWIVTTFGLKHAEGYSIHRTHYSGIAWKIITHLSMPLIVFFRFHSTVCLADVWSNAYRIHKPIFV